MDAGRHGFSRREEDEFVELSSFKAALSALETQESTLMPDISPVTMDSAPESEPEPEPVSVPETESEPETKPGQQQEQQQTEAEAEAETSLALVGPEPSVFSPTRLGARQALKRHSISSGYGSLSTNTAAGTHQLEVDLPLLPPWHHNLPYLLSTYLQLLFNASVLLAAIVAARALQTDVSRRLAAQSSAILREAAACAAEFVENQCATVPGRPALREYCNELEACMEKDPAHSSQINAYAVVLAEAIEAFFAPLTFKTLSLLAALVVVLLFGTNYLFGFFRAKAYYFKLAHPPRAPPERMSYKLAPQRADDIWR